jgi:hypothetical protein
MYGVSARAEIAFKSAPSAKIFTENPKCGIIPSR